MMGTVVSQRWKIAGLAMLAMAVTWPGQAQGRRPVRGGGVPIQFSTPRQEVATTNLTEYTDPSHGDLRKLEAELNKPARLPGRNSELEFLAPLPRPPAGPVIQSKKVRELLDRRKNWAFDNAEDEILGLKSDDPWKEFELDDLERDQTAKSPVFEKFYRGLEQAGSTNQAFGEHEMLLSPDEALELPAFESASPRPDARRAFRSEESGLPSFFQDNSFRDGIIPGMEKASSASGILAPGNNNAWQVRAQENRLQQFKQLIQDDPLRPAAATTLPGLTPSRELGGGPPPLPAAASSLDSRAAHVPGASGFSSAGLVAAPTLASPARPTTLTPAPVPPRRGPKPPAIMEIPRRNF